MELSLDLILNKKLEKIGITGTYPHDNNCYKCDVINIENDEVLFTANYVPIPVFDMWVYLSSNKNRLTKIDILNIIRPFNDYGDWKYDEGVDSEIMNNAGEDL
jgi:hypothetical protein